MKRAIFIILWVAFVIGCGSNDETKYFLTFNQDQVGFEGEISQNQTDLGQYYAVQYQDGKIISFQLFNKKQIKSSHKLIYNESGELKKQRNYDPQGKLLSSFFFNPAGQINKVLTFDANKNIVREELYKKWQEKANISNLLNGQNLLIKAIDYQYEDKLVKKQITYYKLIKYQGQYSQVVDKISEYENNKLILSHVFYYNDLGIKSKVESYKANKKIMVTYYGKNGNKEEKNEFDESGKLIYKAFYDQNDKIIKEVKLN